MNVNLSSSAPRFKCFTAFQKDTKLNQDPNFNDLDEVRDPKTDVHNLMTDIDRIIPGVGALEIKELTKGKDRFNGREYTEIKIGDYTVNHKPTIYGPVMKVEGFPSKQERAIIASLPPNYYAVIGGLSSSEFQRLTSCSTLDRYDAEQELKSRRPGCAS